MTLATLQPHARLQELSERTHRSDQNTKGSYAQMGSRVPCAANQKVACDAKPGEQGGL